MADWYVKGNTATLSHTFYDETGRGCRGRIRWQGDMLRMSVSGDAGRETRREGDKELWELVVLRKLERLGKTAKAGNCA